MKLIIKISVFVLLLLIFKSELKAQNPNIKFVYDTSLGCPPLKVTFTNKSTVGDSFIYQINGQYLSYGDTSFTFTTSGYNTVYLFAYSKKHLIGYAHNTIEILGNPVSISAYDFDHYNIDSLCINEQTVFSAEIHSPSTKTTGLWDFGDGTTQSVNNYKEIKHTYKIKGNYTVKLISTCVCGTDTAQMLFKVKDDMPLTGSFAFNPEYFMICPGELQTFNFSTYHVSSWSINFGDGTSSAKLNNHIYNSVGKYNPILTLSNGCGSDTTLTTSFLVSNSTPITGKPYITVNGSSFCPGEQLMLNSSGNGLNATDFTWYFGDGERETGSWTFHRYKNPGNYNVKLHMINRCGNDTDIFKQVTISSALTVKDFAMSITPSRYVCPGEQIEINYLPVKWYIDFGDGMVEENVRTHSYSKPGKYIVKVTSTNYCGNSRTKTDTVYVKDNLPISGDLTVYWNNSPICPNEVYQPSIDQDNNLIDFFWNFGDGKGTYFGSYAHYTYDNAGKYTVSCTARNGCGYDTTFSEVLEVKPNIKFSDYDFNEINVTERPKCPYGIFSFSSSSPYLTFWDYGDGKNSNKSFLGYEYDTSGIYYIKARMVNGCGNDTTLFDSVDVIDYNRPINFIFNKLYDPVCPDNLFILKSDEPYLDHWSTLWDFGNGDTSYQPDPYYSYPETGIYPVSVRIENECGINSTFHTTIEVKDDVPVREYEVVVNPSTTCPEDKIQYYCNYIPDSNTIFWNFGDGDSATGNGTYHKFKDTGIYNGIVTVTNKCGKTLSKNFKSIINSDARYLSNFGNYYVISHDPCPGDEVEFTSCLYNTNYWDFGDGTDTTTDQAIIKHVYPKKGNYTVIFKSCNYCGDCYIDTSTVCVTFKPQNNSNQIKWQGKHNTGDSIRFSLYKSNNNPRTWDFGDGKGKFVTSLPYIYHVFDLPGDYKVICEIVSNCGDSMLLTSYIAIDEKSLKPLPYFTSDKIEIMKGDSVIFIDKSSNNPTQWQWFFEGGSPNTSNLENPGYIRYDSIGMFDVSLWVTNTYGTTKLIREKYITVKKSSVKADFIANELQISKGEYIRFTDLSAGYIDTWYWQFEGGTPSEALVKIPSYIQYNSVGKFDVKLVVINGFGSDSLLKTNYITVINAPIGIRNEKLSSHIQVYPNPVHNELYLKIQNTTNSVWAIDFISPDGKVIWSEQLNTDLKTFSKVYNVAALPEGLYFLKIISREEQVLFKIIVE